MLGSRPTGGGDEAGKMLTSHYKGSHRNFTHESGEHVTVSGKEGADAKHYQEKLVKQALAAIENETKKKR